MIPCHSYYKTSILNDVSTSQILHGDRKILDSASLRK